MKKSNLYKLVNDEIKKLDISNSDTEEVKMCREYLANNQVIKIEDFLEVDIWELLKCLSFIKLGTSVLESENISESIKIVFSNLDIDITLDALNILICYKTDGVIDQVIEYLNTDNIVKDKLLLRKIYPNNEDNRLALTEFKKLSLEERKHLIDFLLVLRDYDEDIITSLVSIYHIQKCMIYVQRESERVAESVDFNVRNRDKKRALGDALRTAFKTNEVLRDAKEVFNYISEYDRLNIREDNRRKKEISGLKNAISLLESETSKREITRARDIVKGIKNPIIKLRFLEYISSYNNEYYKELEEELDYLNQNTKIKYQALLRDYGINDYNYDVLDIMHNSVSDVSEMLNILRKFDLGEEFLIKVLSNSTLDIVTSIKNFIDKGYLSKSIIQANIDLFYVESDKYRTLCDNILMIQEFNINPSIFRGSIFVMFNDNGLLKSNLELLDRYDLMRFIRNSSDYSFLLDNRLYLKIDKLLELGYEEYLENDLSLLNSNNIKRLEVLKAMGVEVESYEELINVLRDDVRFFIPDSELDNYIPNVLPYMEEVVGDISLDSYRNSSRIYNINGVLVSSPKVLRLLDQGNSMYQAIVSGMNLSNDEYERVASVFKVKGK